MLHVWNGSRNRAWMGAVVAVLIIAGLLLPGKQIAQGVTITGAFPSFNSTSIGVFQLNGSAALSGNAVLLTPSQGGKVGSMFWRNKISLRDNRSFSAQFCISMDTPGSGGADGIVFVIQSQTSSPSSTGGGIGYNGISPSIGIEFDTYANNGGSEDYDPSGDGNHIAFLVNGNPRYVHYWDPSWTLETSTTYAWVDYDGIAQKLEVRAATSNVRPSSAILTENINLGNGSYIPQDVYVGFTAATGGSYENQWVRSFYINNDFIDGGINPGTTTYTSSPTTVSVSASPASAAANGSYNVGLTARALDMNNAAVPSWPVTFSITSGTATLSSASATTDTNGYATTSLSSHTPGTVTVRATADGGAYAETTVTFTNTAPTASGQSITATEDTQYAGALSGSDPDGDALTYAVVGSPSHGTATVTNVATGSFSYTPAANYPTGHASGSDSFTFRVTDAHGAASGVAMVSVTVTSVNDVPVIAEGASRAVTMDEDSSPTAFALTLHATDADGDTVTWSVPTPASHGTAGVDSSTGVVSYAPAANWNGTDSFVVQASDGYGGTAATTVTVTVNPRNDAPVNTALPVISGTAHPGQTLSVTTGTWDDSIDAPLQGVLSYSYYWQRSSNGGTTWSNINGVTTTGTYAVTVTDLGCLLRCAVNCKDTRMGNPPDVVAEAIAASVAVTNSSPVIQDGGSVPVTMDEDGFPTPFALTLHATDADSDTVTWSIATTASHGTAGVGSSTGVVSYAPTADWNGTDTFVVRASDAWGGTASTTVTVTVTPVVDIAPDAVTTNEDTAITFNAITGTNGASSDNFENPSRCISAVTQGSHSVTVTFLADGTITYTPVADWNGTDSFTYTVTSPAGITETATVTVTVTPVNDAPAAVVPGTSVTTNEDTQVSVSGVSVTDVDVNEATSPNNTVRSTLTVSHGTLSLSKLTGLTFSVGDGTADATMTFNGTLTDVNAALATLSYLPDKDYNSNWGSESCTVAVSDLGHTGSGGVLTDSKSVPITVTPVNDVPSFTKGADQTVLEDCGSQTVSNWATNISAGPADEAGQTLTFTASASNTALFSVQPAITSAGTLTYTPAADANGSATITVTLKDNGGTANGGVDTSVSQTFTITVTAVNDVPSFTKGADQTVLEDCGSQTVSTWATTISAGPNNEASQSLTFHVSNDNNALFSVQPAITSTGTLTYTPAADANGSATVTVYLQDSGGTANGGVDTSVSQTFTITVTAVNDVPSFTKGADQTVLEDCGSQTVSTWATTISAGPADESGQTVNFIVTNNNNLLFSTQPSISPAGTLTYTPAPNQNGLATVTVRIHDNGGTANGGGDASATQTFTITVTAVNDAPAVVVPGTSVTTNEDTQVSVSGVSVTDVDVNEATSPNNTVRSTLTVSHGTLSLSKLTGLTFSVGDGTADATMTFNGTLTDVNAALATLSYLPDKDYNSNWGSESCTVTVSDLGHTGSGGALTDSKSVPITVTPVNDPATVTLPSPITLDEDVNTAISGIVVADIDVNETASPGNTVQITLTAAHGTLSLSTATGVTFSIGDGTADATMTFDGTLADVNAALATLHYRSNLHYNGSEGIAVACTDLGHTGSGDVVSHSGSLNITVTSVNDVPSFTKGADQTVLEDCGSQTVSTWATTISAGPADESGQTVNFIVTNNNNLLFSTQPSISPAGTLTYTPAPNQNGLATVTVQIHDDGGTEHGGVDTSASQTFTITVTPVNDMPSFIAGPDVTVDEDAKTQTIPGWATAISAGPPNEAGQQVVFSVTTDNPTLFSVQPSLSPSGTLTFAPAPNRNGVAHLTITLTDDGTRGTTALTTLPQVAALVVNPINDPPVCLRTPAITGKGLVGTVLTADPGSWDDHVDQTPGHVALRIQWLRGKSPVGVDAVPITGATELTYEVQKQDVGWYLGFQVVAMDDGEGTPRTMETSAYAPVFIRGFDADTVPPTLVMFRDLPVKVSESTLVLDGLVSDAGSGVRSFSINGTPVIPYADGSFHEVVPLHRGDNAIVLTAVDNAGNTWSHTHHVTGVAAAMQQQTHTIVLTVGKKSMSVDGHATALDVAPVIREGRTMVPFRAIVEGLGGSVSWNATTRQVTIKVRGQTVVLTIDRNTASVNGHAVSVDPVNLRVTPFITSGRTYIPVRFLT
ncbi:MAG TPA: tandem-95 repeat protein, partial [Candidatus Cryosericum sp.]|nr:tandem-95 repeat protein [Candidatus Cryosericum sp.]